MKALDYYRKYIIESMSKPNTIGRFIWTVKINAMSAGKVLDYYYTLIDRGGNK